MIGDDAPMPVSMNNSMEITEDKEPTEEVSGTPEWAGNPGIHVIIITWRDIIGHYGRAFGIVVLIDL
jgi:hypothetical protein